MEDKGYFSGLLELHLALTPISGDKNILFLMHGGHLSHGNL